MYPRNRMSTVRDHPATGPAICKRRAATTRCDMVKAKRKRTAIEVGSGNVFTDLGSPDADERQTKVRLAVAIQREIVAQEWSQAQAAAVLGVNQPKVSALLKCKLDGFSVERLMNFLTALGNDVEIVIKPRRGPRRPGRILVVGSRSPAPSA
jgi:predicted XRE-type DNA-binding protein